MTFAPQQEEIVRHQITQKLSEITQIDISSDREELEKFSVKLPMFEGHFELLLDMIEQQNVDICDVSLSDVTRQYLEFLSLSRTLDLSLSSEFLLVAAYLMEQKSRKLLPEKKLEEVADEVETSLVEHVMQYRLFKKIAAVLKERKDQFSRIFHRSKMEAGTPDQKSYYLRDVSVTDLTQAFRKIWLEVKDRKSDHEIVDELITVEEKIVQIREMIRTEKEGIKFESLFKTRTRLEVIVTFLAILELVRQHDVHAKQDGLFGDIMLFSSGKAE